MGRLSDLKFLNNLRGKLVILWLLKARVNEAKEANLGAKQYLETLFLSYYGQSAEDTYTQESECEAEEALVLVMESLQPHLNLKELYIEGYQAVRFPNWMMNDVDGLDLLLQNLVTIKLHGCNRFQVLPPFGQLPFLELLYL